MVKIKLIEEEDQSQVLGQTELVPNEEKLKAEADIAAMVGDLKAAQKRKENLAERAVKPEILKRTFWSVREEFLTLQKDLSEAESQLEFWQENLRKTKLALQHEVSHSGIRLDIYERARVSNKPSDPTWGKIVGIGLGIGIAVGLVFVLLAEVFDHSFHTVDQAINELKLPILGAVDEIVTPSEAFRRRLISWGIVPAVGVFLALVLIANITLTIMSLETPDDFEMLRDQPVEFVKEKLGR